MRARLRFLAEQMNLLPNQLTAARIVLLPILWAFAFLNLPVAPGIGLIISFATDVLDGYVARRLGQVSAFGSKLDSLADNLLIPSGLVWLWMLKPEIYRDHGMIWIISILLYGASLLVGAIKFRRFANLHLHSKRYGSVLMYLFVPHAFIADQYSLPLFYLAIGMFVLSSTEGLLLQLICSQVNEHMGSILFVLRRRTSR